MFVVGVVMCRCVFLCFDCCVLFVVVYSLVYCVLVSFVVVSVAVRCSCLLQTVGYFVMVLFVVFVVVKRDLNVVRCWCCWWRVCLFVDVYCYCCCWCGCCHCMLPVVVCCCLLVCVLLFVVDCWYFVLLLLLSLFGDVAAA